VDKIRTVPELLTQASVWEAVAAQRYRALAVWSEGPGRHPELAALFRRLAEMEDRHFAEAAERSGTSIGPADLPATEEAWPPVDLTPYRALADAVQSEMDAFARYTYIAADAASPAVRELAEALARDELQHASLLRRFRRQAFHADRPPPATVPATLEALNLLVAAWDQQIADAPPEASDALIEKSLEQLLEIGDRATNEAVVKRAQILAERSLRLLALRRSPLPESKDPNQTPAG
jgi:rubrerythrin